MVSGRVRRVSQFVIERHHEGSLRTIIKWIRRRECAARHGLWIFAIRFGSSCDRRLGIQMVCGELIQSTKNDTGKKYGRVKPRSSRTSPDSPVVRRTLRKTDRYPPALSVSSGRLPNPHNLANAVPADIYATTSSTRFLLRPGFCPLSVTTPTVDTPRIMKIRAVRHRLDFANAVPEAGEIFGRRRCD